MALFDEISLTASSSGSSKAFPQVTPARLQHFEYEPLSLDCGGSDEEAEWIVMRQVQSKTTRCGTTNWGISNGSVCTIRNLYKQDSGEYWCGTVDGNISSAINITVTGKFTTGCLHMNTCIVPVSLQEPIDLHSLDCTDISVMFRIL